LIASIAPTPAEAAAVDVHSTFAIRDLPLAAVLPPQSVEDVHDLVGRA